MKKLFQKPFFKKIINPILRGIVKQVPFVGAPVVELITNASTPDGQPKKHTSLSQIIQWVVVGVVVLDIVINKGANLTAIFQFVLDLFKG